MFPKSEYELEREKNIKKRNAFLSSIVNQEEHTKALSNIKNVNDSLKSSKLKRKRKSDADETFKYTGTVPLLRRRSARIAKLPAEKLELPNEAVFVKPAPKKQRVQSNNSPRPRTAHIVKTPEEITDKDIANIAVKATSKLYSSNGTTCHQCRQKTADQKTTCRNKFCYGIRGQYCGPCLKGRYGESAKLALKDPNWHCLVCRNECNCSFCLPKKGLSPTGILAPYVREQGYQSVKHYLEDLELKKLQ